MTKSVGRLISILYRKSQVYMNIALKPYDITAAEQPFLFILYKNSYATQEELSSYLNIDKAATARVIKSLLEKGLVTKQKNDNDKRFNQIFLTEKGNSSREHVLKQLRRWSDILTENLSEESKEATYAALERMVENVNRMDFKKIGEARI